MKASILILAGVLTLASLPVATPVAANEVERACLQSGRQAATPQLCGCIGSAARLTLNRSDQREAARIFRDPQRAQDARMSDRSQDEAFWERYRTFGQTAEAMCG